MTWSEIYWSGVIFCMGSTVLFYIHHYLTVSRIFVKNMRKIGLEVMVGYADFVQPNSTGLGFWGQGLINLIACLLSWPMFFAISWNLCLGIIKTFRNIFYQPTEVRSVLYKLTTFDLSPEEVFVLDKKLRTAVSGKTFTKTELFEAVTFLTRHFDIELNFETVLKLSEANGILSPLAA